MTCVFGQGRCLESFSAFAGESGRWERGFRQFRRQRLNPHRNGVKCFLVYPELACRE
jgi:hypothetical protein